VSRAAFSPDGRAIVTACPGAAETRLWDANRGTSLGPPFADGEAITAVAFSPDSRRLITGGPAGSARVRDLAGVPVTPPLRHEKAVNAVGFGPDGKRVVTASDDGTARVWDAATGEPITRPLALGGAVSHAAFSPDGRFVAAADELQFEDVKQRGAAPAPRGRAQVWDTATGEAVTPLLVHDGHISHVAFSPDGRRVVTAGDDGTARVWDLPVDDRPVEDWTGLVQVLHGRQFRARGAFVPLSAAALAEQWHGLRQRLPRDAAPPPEHWLARHRREADACEKAHVPFAAAWHLDRVIAAQPEDGSAWARRAEARAALGDRDSAIRDLTRAMELTGDDWQLPFRRGELHAASGAFARAEEDYSRAIRLQAGEARVWLRLAEAHIELDRVDDATADLQRAAELPARDPDDRDTRAVLQNRLAGYLRAAFLQKVPVDPRAFRIQVAPDRADGRYQAGDTPRLTITSEKPGYLYVFRCEPGDRVVCLFPSKAYPDARVEAGQKIALPAQGAEESFGLGAPHGLYQYKAVVTREPLRTLPLESLVKDPLTVLGVGQKALDRLKALDDELRGGPADWAAQLTAVTVGVKTVGAFLGVSDYSKAQPPQNNIGGAKEAEQMARAMRENGMVQEALVLLDGEVTRDKIKELLLQKLPALTRPGDTVVLCWSGYGARGKGPTDGATGGGRTYLVPHDCCVDRMGQTAVSADALALWLRALDGRRILILVEGAYGGGMARALDPATTTLLAACGKDQQSYNHPEQDTGFFSLALLEYLRHAKGPLDLADAYRYVKDRMPKLLKEVDPSLEQKQTPLLFPAP
jgi:tetratricopeptide (TPR) repeat protein